MRKKVLYCIWERGIHVSFGRIEFKTGVRVKFRILCICCQAGKFLITVGCCTSVSRKPVHRLCCVLVFGQGGLYKEFESQTLSNDYSASMDELVKVREGKR